MLNSLRDAGEPGEIKSPTEAVLLHAALVVSSSGLYFLLQVIILPTAESGAAGVAEGGAGGDRGSKHRDVHRLNRIQKLNQM